MTTLLLTLALAAPPAIQAAVDAVVRVSTPRAFAHACPLQGGLLVTNAHVVAGVTWLRWSDAHGEGLARRIYPGTSVLADADLALLQVVSGQVGREFAVTPAPPRPGDRVFVRGFHSENRRTVLGGRTVTTKVTRIEAGHVIFEDDALGGSSGGCVFNERGEVVGINAASISTDTKDSRAGSAVGLWGAWGSLE